MLYDLQEQRRPRKAAAAVAAVAPTRTAPASTLAQTATKAGATAGTIERPEASRKSGLLISLVALLLRNVKAWELYTGIQATARSSCKLRPMEI